jgi:hypothetical protein
MSKLTFLSNGRDYPRETRRLELGEYHPDLAGDFLDVWVNFSRGVSEQRLELALESLEISKLPLGKERDKRLGKLLEKTQAFHAEWWGVPLEQVRQLYEIDTALYEWITFKASELRGEYVDERKKAGSVSTDSLEVQRNTTLTGL